VSKRIYNVGFSWFLFLSLSFFYILIGLYRLVTLVFLSEHWAHSYSFFFLIFAYFLSFGAIASHYSPPLVSNDSLYCYLYLCYAKYCSEDMGTCYLYNKQNLKKCERCYIQKSKCGPVSTSISIEIRILNYVASW
jgi:hypothetical protein